MNRTPNFQSLIPESPLLVYPSVAATLGLEEATMVAVLCEVVKHRGGLQSNGFTWHQLDKSTLDSLAPFWQPIDIQRVCTNLREKGVLLIASAPYSDSHQLKFAFNQRSETSPAVTPMAKAGAASSPATQANQTTKNLIAPNWHPDQDTLARLAQLNIPESFCRELTPEFVNYWHERGATAMSWGSKFMNHVIPRWRAFEAKQHERAQETPMPRNWRPSEDAMDVLTRHAGISRPFIEDAIPEFELYWRERGTTSDNWNKKFRDHVHRQWVRYKSALEHDTVPKRIPDNWRPSEDVYEVLRLANIDIEFALTLLPEFVIYWRDSNQVHSSWNTRFLQYVKYQWARRGINDNQTKPTRELSLAEQLTDRSWAL